MRAIAGRQTVGLSSSLFCVSLQQELFEYTGLCLGADIVVMRPENKNSLFWPQKRVGIIVTR